MRNHLELRRDRTPTLIAWLVAGAVVLSGLGGGFLVFVAFFRKPAEQAGQPGGDQAGRPPVNPPGGFVPPVGNPGQPLPLVPPGKGPGDPPRGGRSIYEAIEEAVRTRALVQSRRMGHLGDREFLEVAPNGGVMVGLDVGVGEWNRQVVIHYIRGIYQSPTAEVLGTGQGGAARTRVARVQARAGYAVGAVTVKAGAGIDGLSVTFLAIDGEALDPARSYRSDWLGGLGGNEPVTLGGDGAPLVGLFGKVDTRQQTSREGESGHGPRRFREKSAGTVPPFARAPFRPEAPRSRRPFGC